MARSSRAGQARAAGAGQSPVASQVPAARAPWARRAALAVGLAGLTAAGGARAQAQVVSGAVVQSRAPDRWDRARDPGAARAERILEEASDKLADAETQGGGPRRAQAAGEARSMLEQIGGSRSPDDRVKFYYGHALSLMSDDSGVIAALAPLVSTAFDHPLGAGVMFDLAVAYAKIERFGDEVSIYDRLLDAVDSPSMRTTILSNRGESRAKLGDFAGAVDDYRRAIEADPLNASHRWGLVLTLDRWGDLSQALREGVFAWDVDKGRVSAIDNPSTFYVPAYDKWWFHALRELSGAQRSTTPEDRLTHLQAADRFYELYLARALSTDRWVPLARARRKLIEGQIAAARKAAPARKRAPAESAPW